MPSADCYSACISSERKREKGNCPGITATFFINTIFILLGIVFGSIALANYFHVKLDHEFMGYWIVAGGDILLAIILLFLVVRRKVPLLTNLFLRAIVSKFNIRDDEDQ